MNKFRDLWFFVVKKWKTKENKKIKMKIIVFCYWITSKVNFGYYRKAK